MLLCSLINQAYLINPIVLLKLSKGFVTKVILKSLFF